MRIVQSVKRKLALLLSVVMILQPVLSSVAAVTGDGLGEGTRANSGPYDISTGDPFGAFETLTLSTGPQVGSDNTIYFRVDGMLNDGFLQETYEEFLFDGLSEADWDENYEGIQSKYSSYDAYLEAQTGLPQITFYCNVQLQFPDGTAGLDIGKELVGEIVTDGDNKEVLGEYYLFRTSKDDASPVYMLGARLLKKVYNRSDVTFGQNIFASLSSNYIPGSSVDLTPGTGDNDFIVTIPDGSLGELPDCGAEITKEFTPQNPGDTGIEYIIKARMKDKTKLATVSNAASPSTAAISEDGDVYSDAALYDDVFLDHGEGVFDDEMFNDSEDAYEDAYNEDILYDNIITYDNETLLKSLASSSNANLFFSDLATPYNAARTVVTSLKGLVINDRLPEGLTLVSADVRFSETGTKWNNIKTSITDGVLNYTVPSAGAQYVEIRIKTRLSDAYVNEFMTSVGNSGVEWKFPNTASLKAPDGSTLAVSKKVEPEIKLNKPFAKEGKAVANSANLFEWTLTVNSAFSNKGVHLYAVDHVEDVVNTHKYSLTDNKIKVNDTQMSVTNIGKLTESETNNFSYNNITKVSTLEEFLKAKVQGYSGETAVMYEYETADGMVDAVMIIPLYPAHLNGKTEIVYRTELSKTLKELYQSGNADKKLELKNEAKILWKWPDGQGPGTSDEYGGATIDKTWPVSYSLVEKTSGGYSEDKNTITWNFNINKFKVASDEITITDVFMDSEQMLESDIINKTKALILTSATKEEKNRTVSATASESTSGDYYEIAHDTTAGTTTLTVHLYNVTKDQQYDFSIVTEVTAVLDSSENKKEIKNTADVHVKIGDTKIDFTTGSGCDVKNTLIQKSVVEFEDQATGKKYLYDYKNHIVKWRILINPRNLSISEAKLNDVLPPGTELEDLTKVQYGDTDCKFQPSDDKNTWSANITDSISVTLNKTGQDNQKGITFTFQDNSSTTCTINEPLIFEFTTKVDEETRKQFKSLTECELKNKATLEGKLDAGTTVFTASDTAINKFSPKPMIKTGKFVSGEEYEFKDAGIKAALTRIDWTIYVNRAQANIQGATIKDEIQDFMELDTGSIKVTEVVLDALGNPTDKPEQNLPKFVIDQDYKHFSYTIPADTPYNTTLKFEFTTVFVDTAYAADINNEVSIEGGGMSDKTDTANKGDMHDFIIDSYATAKGLYFTKIFKTSVNQSKDFPLQGAKFTLWEQKLKSNASGESVDNWEDTGNPIVRFTNRRGNLNFLFLKENTMYRFEETEAPSGYEKSNDDWYVVPKKGDGIFPPEAAESPTWVTVNEGSNHYASVTVKDKVTEVSGGSGSLAFTKQGHGGQILEDKVEFKIRSRYLTPPSVTTNEAGEVIFEKLDVLPDSNDFYSVEEVKAPTGYKLSNKLKGRVWKDGSDVHSEWMDKTFKDNPVLVNEPITQSGAFQKTDQNGNLLTSIPVTFDVYRRGDGGQKLTPDKTDKDEIQVIIDVDGSKVVANKKKYEPYKLNPQLQSVNGVITFKDFLYGEYKLVEQSHEEGVIDNATLYLRIDESGAYACSNDPTVTNKPDWEALKKADGSYFEVSNIVQWGFINVTKVVGEPGSNNKLVAALDSKGNYIPIKGAEFLVSKKTGTGDTYTPYMTLLTDAYGKFEIDDNYYVLGPDKDGTISKKQLVVGEYKIKEVSCAGYQVSGDEYAFEIEGIPNTDFDGGKGAKHFYIDSTADIDLAVDDNDANLFLNQPLRGSVSLKKVDTDYSKTQLDGAEFEVWTVDDAWDQVSYVADLNQSSVGEAYTLAPGDTGDTNFVATDEIGREYLKEIWDTDTYTYKLLYGKYLLVETQAPTLDNLDPGYYTIDDTMKFKIDIDKDNISALTDDGDIKNTITKYPVVIQKKIETLNTSSAGNSYEHAGYDAGVGFTFKLSADGTTYSGPVNLNQDGTFTSISKTTIKKESSDKFAVADFGMVAPGTYLLEEVGLPLGYGTLSGTGIPYVTPMKPVVVTVTKTGVSYTYKDSTTMPDNSTVDEAVENAETAVSGNSTATAQLVVRNNFLKGSAEGTKVSITSANGVPSMPLEGVQFTLKESSPGKIGKALTVSSGIDGNISFTNVPYGHYILEETTPLPGYQKMEDINVVIEGSALVQIKNNNDTKQIDNSLILKTLKFAKVDQHGMPIKSDKDTKKISFEVVADPENRTTYHWPDSYTTYDDDSTKAIVTNDTDGIVTIPDLAYGTYTVTEAGIGGDIDAVSKAEFTIVVGPGEAADKTPQTKISLTQNAPATGLEAVIAKNNSGSEGKEIYDFTSKDEDKNFDLVNTLKYGYLNIQKLYGEDNRTGEAAPNVTPGASLADRQFTVYEKKGNESQPDEANSTPYITLKTGSDGSFMKDKDSDKYIDAITGLPSKQLITGKYFIKEVITDHDIYRNPSPDAAGYTEFEIKYYNDSTHPITELTYNGTQIETKIISKDDSSSPFYNIIKRGGIRVEKQDAHNNTILAHGAEFAVYADSKCETSPVAALQEDADKTGHYILSNVLGGVTIAPQAKDNIPYLYQSEVNGVKGSWWLLEGTYYVKEITPPVGYNLSNNITGPIIVEDNAIVDQDITNEILAYPVTIQKLIEQRKAEADTSSTVFAGYAKGKGFIFTLTEDAALGAKGPDNKSDSDPKYYQEFSTDAEGIAELQNVATGTYLLSEKDTPEEYDSRVDLMNPIFVTVTKDGVSYAKTGNGPDIDTKPATAADESTRRAEPGVVGQGTKAAKLIVRNNYLLGQADGTKAGLMDGDTGTQVTNLNGAIFELTEKNASGKTSIGTLTATSNGNGKISFTDLPYGTYLLKEITPPAGYKAMDDIEVVINSPTTTITSKNRTVIDNSLILTKLKFMKTNQNGEPVTSDTAELKFTVTADQNNRAQYQWPVTYTTYDTGAEVSNGTDGSVSITDLAYGTYTVKEEIDSSENSLLESGQSAEFIITVAPGTIDAPEITLLQNDSKGNEILKASLSEPDSAGEYDFTGSFRLKNNMKHGYVKINKVAGNEDSGGFSATDIALGGRQFQLYQKFDSDNGTWPPDRTVYASLVTDEKTGDFKRNPDDSSRYENAAGDVQNDLIIGEYYIVEIPGDDKMFKEPPQPGVIEIVDHTVSNQVTEVTYDGTKVDSKRITATEAASPFCNIIKRGGIKVTKQDDADHNMLASGAEFTVSTDSEGFNIVAFLKEDMNAKGTYVLDSKLNGIDLSAKKLNGIPYLYQDKDGLWWLLEGSYHIIETKAPEGYDLPLESAIKMIKVKDGEIVPKEITNKVDPVDVRLLKVDQNGDPVKKGDKDEQKVEFTVTRVNSGVNGTATLLDVRAAALLNGGIVYNDNDGKILLENLISGTYKLTEMKPDWSQDNAEVIIKVEQVDKSTPKVTIESSSLNGKDTQASVESMMPDGALRPISDFSVNIEYAVKNHLNYGLVNIHKVTANDDEVGLSPTNNPMKGVVFHVHEDKNGDGKPDSQDGANADDHEIPVLELVTGSDGTFLMDSDNQYLNEGGTAQGYRLVYGRTYLLHEYKLPESMIEKYKPDDNYYKFQISGDEAIAKTGNTWYIGTNQPSGVVLSPDNIVVDPTEGGKALTFPNGPLCRGTVELIKTDADKPDVKVKGAKFDVYAKNESAKPIAVLEDDDNGIYRLKPGSKADGYEVQNPSGQDYLKPISGGGYTLLCGAYFIKEVKAPAGYMTPEDKDESYWYFKISSNNLDISNKGNDDNDLTDSSGKPRSFTNTLWKRDIIIEKQVEDTAKGKFHTAGENDDTFTFQLKGTPSNATPPILETKTVSTAGPDKGSVRFENIPSGSYVLTEIMTGAARQGGTLADVYVTPKSINIMIDENGVHYDSDNVIADHTTVKNLLKRGSIEGKKVTRDMAGDVPLAGAEFELKPVAPQRTEILTAISDSQGRIAFKDVPLGTYELTEVKAPAGYNMSTEVITVTVGIEGKVVRQGTLHDGTQSDIKILNDAFGSLTIAKTAEMIENNDLAGVYRPGAGFLFKVAGKTVTGDGVETVVEESDIAGADKIEIRKSGSAEDGIYITTGAEGKIIISGLPVGDYTVQEQVNEKNNADGSYVLDTAVRQAKLTVSLADGKVVEPDVRMSNRLRRAKIEGIKTKSDKTSPLAGAVIGLFPSTATEFTDANLFCGLKLTTGEDGMIRFENIPVGTYLIRELEAPSGYYLDSGNMFRVAVKDDGSVVITGEKVKGGTAEGPQPIIITNTRKSSGGGDTPPPSKPNPSDPTNPGPGVPPTEPQVPTDPQAPTQPQPELPHIPVVPNPGGGTDITVPPDVPPESDVIVTNPGGDTVYEGRTDENNHITVELPAGDYILTVIDDEGVPLASMTFTIEDEDVPLANLAAPNAGDNSIPTALLSMTMLAALAGFIYIQRKKRENGEK